MPFLNQYPFLKMIQDLARKRRLEVFLVGGFLRDFALGRPCNDFDFAVSRNAIALARVFARNVKGAFVLLDEEHGCARVVTKERRGRLTYDFADYRAETLRKDLGHRDFTINTLVVNLAACPVDAELKDVIQDYRKAWPDIRGHRIRMASAQVFREDPLRILRAFSLKAALGFDIDVRTRQQICLDKERLRDVSPERVRDEFFKILKTDAAARILKEMDRLKILEQVIPQVRVMYRVKQGTYHHLDVWPHSLETVVQMDNILAQTAMDPELSGYLAEPLGADRPRRALMKLGALLHDIGKPESKRKQDNRTLFHGHERIGSQIVNHVARMLKLSTRERHALMDMVACHLRPGYLSNFKCPSAKAVFRYFRDTKEEAVSVALISLADQKSTRGPLTTEEDQRHHEEICWQLVHAYFENKKKVPVARLLTGDDLIETLKLPPSPKFSVILREIEEQQALGAVTSKPEALALAERIAARFPGTVLSPMGRTAGIDKEKSTDVENKKSRSGHCPGTRRGGAGRRAC
ncbi:MAG TPA: HDIG domain-containing protein [Candidatus Omnitrophota bacterium]|nr:HDIG domain-containing protein [Candidatus Omnitrophota bacterium]